LERAKKGTVWLSSVCDPYQPLEARYQLTKCCLEELVKSRFPVNIQTKSNLVLRDLDLFREFEEIEVGFTITTDDEGIARLFEPGAAPVSERLKALERIHSSGIKTFAFIGPLLPGNPHRLVADLCGLVNKVFIDRMNYLSPIKSFYRQVGLEFAMKDEFFLDYRTRLTSELKRRKMIFEVVF
jgi:DNA repair photolyase